MLDSIGLSNFKAFQQVALPLSKLTLLAGWNSSGKSTVLQAVAALRQSHEAGLLATEGLLLNGRTSSLGPAGTCSTRTMLPRAERQRYRYAQVRTVGLSSGRSGTLQKATFSAMRRQRPATADRPRSRSLPVTSSSCTRNELALPCTSRDRIGPSRWTMCWG